MQPLLCAPVFEVDLDGGGRIAGFQWLPAQWIWDAVDVPIHLNVVPAPHKHVVVSGENRKRRRDTFGFNIRNSGSDIYRGGSKIPAWPAIPRSDAAVTQIGG